MSTVSVVNGVVAIDGVNITEKLGLLLMIQRKAKGYIEAGEDKISPTVLGSRRIRLIEALNDYETFKGKP